MVKEKSALKRFMIVWTRILDVFVFLAGILLWGQMVIVNIEVVSRYLGHPTTWVPEISSIIILWIPFMVASWVLKREAHVKMDLLLQRLSPKAQTALNFINSLIGAIVMFIITGISLKTTIYWIGYKTPTILMLPRAPIIGIIFIGSFMFGIQFFIDALNYFIKLK
jgi:TRAP-type C4-dicarboxylate transport system permease small subunit